MGHFSAVYKVITRLGDRPIVLQAAKWILISVILRLNMWKRPLLDLRSVTCLRPGRGQTTTPRVKKRVLNSKTGCPSSTIKNTYYYLRCPIWRSNVRHKQAQSGSDMHSNTTRGFLWSDVETRTLLNIWGEQDIQTALDGSFRNSFVYRDVACRLAAMGFDRTPEQCRVRIKSLKRQFLLAKEGNLRNSGQYHKICKFYDIMEAILSNRPTSNPPEMLEYGPGEEEAGDALDEEGEDAQESHSENAEDSHCPPETEVNYLSLRESSGTVSRAECPGRGELLSS
uniref:Myb/SANT-like DNA-binding domain-containing protein n=1 Tax=Periophthalmus magnuspinnatus TaxID=409849 RepID=A0A3B4ABH8_9GOBI